MKRWMPVLLVAAIACESSHIRWNDAEAAPGDTTGSMTLDENGRPKYSTSRWQPSVPPDSAMCPHSLASVAGQNVQFSTWLRRRPDSTVRVMAARRDSSGWTPPATVDSLDTAKLGCSRPSPSIALSEDGSVHVAYSIKAPEGYGVFFGHSMDSAVTFHDPMIVVYGDRLSATAIASSGSRVAIAYEDPSGSVRRIDMALSLTQGHSFEPRVHASPDEMTAMRPRIAIHDSVVALSFAGADTTQRTVRIGYVRK